VASRLPTPGSDSGQWGQILNDYLAVEHNADGTLKQSATIAAKYTKPVLGIPAGDLTSQVQTSIAKADTSVQSVNAVFPSSGNVTLAPADIGAIPITQKGTSNGVASLDGSSRLVAGQLPTSVVTKSTNSGDIGKAVDAYSGLPLSVGGSTDIDTARAPYSVIPGVTANPNVGIQSALDQAGANYASTGVTQVVRTPAGIYAGCQYLVNATHAQTCNLVSVPYGVIWHAEGAVLKLADAAAKPGGCVNAHLVSTPYPYGTNDASKKAKIEIWGLEVDGNASNQTAYTTGYTGPHGIWTGVTDSALYVHCKVKNVYGTSNAPPGETFHFEANNSKNVTYMFCEADGGGSSSATGFSADNSFNVSWISCKAHDMQYGQGFTHWQSAKMTYLDCHAYSCPVGGGFNSEMSDTISYTSCTAGGKTPLIWTGDPQSPFFASGQQTLGSATGFKIQGSRNVTLTGCVAQYNGINLKVNTNSVTVSINRTITAGGTVGETTATINEIPPFLSQAGIAETLVGRPVTLTGGTGETLVVQAVSGNVITFTSTIANAGHTGIQYQTLPRTCEGVYASGCNFRYSTQNNGLGTADVIVGGDSANIPIVSAGGAGANTVQVSGFPIGAQLGIGQTVVLTGTIVITQPVTTAVLGASTVTLGAVPANTLVTRSQTVNPTFVTLSGGGNPDQTFFVANISGNVLTLSGATVASNGFTTATWTSGELMTISGSATATSTLTFTGTVQNSGRTLVQVSMNQLGCWVEGQYNDVINGFQMSSGNSQMTITAANPATSYFTSGGRREAISGVSASVGSWLYRLTNGTTGVQALGINGQSQTVTVGRVRARRAVVDVAATITVTDDIVAWTSLTAARTATLPALSAVATGTEFQIADESGNASVSNTITLTPTGADTIQGSAAITAAYGVRRVYSAGTKWIAS
jgi:hypothetical protein